jgi:hypothetical protein
VVEAAVEDTAARLQIATCAVGLPPVVIIRTAFAFAAAAAAAARRRDVFMGAEEAQQGSGAAKELGVAGREAVPDAPDVFPGFVPYAVEESELDRRSAVFRPPVAYVCHAP